MRYDVIREDPVVPPVKEITLHLTPQELQLIERALFLDTPTYASGWRAANLALFHEVNDVRGNLGLDTVRFK